MSLWIHSMCDACWNEKNPNRPAHRVIDQTDSARPAQCCFCAKVHNSGIYTRADPKTTACNGAGPEHKEND